MMVTQETQGFLDRFSPVEDNSPTSCVLILLLAIDVVVEVQGVPLPSFYIQGVGVIRKVPKLVTIVVLLGLYLLELSCRHLVVIWVYADPSKGLLSHLSHVPCVHILDKWLFILMTLVPSILPFLSSPKVTYSLYKGE
jgi:hypothetical protein